MKKLISLICALILCAALFSCTSGGGSTGGTQAPGTTANTQSTTGKTQVPTSATTAKPITPEQDPKPDIFPAAPEGLTEKTCYDFGESNIRIIKQYLNENGHCVEEHIYDFDTTLCALFPSAIAKYEVNSSGTLLRAEITEVAHPIHGIPATVSTIEQIDHTEYDYKVLNSKGKTIFYIAEKLDSMNRTVETTYFTRDGKLSGTTKTEYHQNGENSLIEQFDANGKLICRCTYKEDGNLLSAEKYDLEDDSTLKVTAEYDSKGKILEYVFKYYSKNHIVGTEKALFDAKGRVYSYRNRTITYLRESENLFIPRQVFSTIYTTYDFDAQGYVTTSTQNSTSSYNSVVLSYNYDSLGRIVSAVRNTLNGKKTVLFYKYNEDGSYALTVSNTNGVAQSVTRVNAQGYVTWQANLNGNTVTSSQAYSYNDYGSVTSYEEYKNEKLVYSEKYTFDEEGRITESIIKDVKNNRTQRTTFTYNADGGYTATEYAENGTHSTVTYNKKNQIVKTSTTKNGYMELTTYEYYPEGNLHSSSYYVKNELVSQSIYNTDGNISKLLVMQNGQAIITEYIRENGIPKRMNTYTGATLTAYTDVEYFSYESDDVNCPKSMRTYTAEGELVYIAEYKLISLGETTASATVKEEMYENGEIIRYFYAEYDDESGNILSSKVFADGTLIETEYNGYGSEENNVLSKKTYVGGVLVSTYEISKESNDIVYVTEYNENGKPTAKYVYFKVHSPSGTDSLSLKETYTYEYHANGELYKEDFAENDSNPKKTGREFNENGVLVKVYDLDYNGADVYKGGIIDYDENGNVIRSEEITGSIRKITSYTYGENGKPKKSVTEYYNNGVLGSTASNDYDENGNVIYKRSETSSGSVTEEFFEYNGEGKLTYRKMVIDGEVMLEEKNAYNASGVLVKEEYYDYRTSGRTTIDEYSETGKPLYHYNKNSKGDVQESRSTYDENDNLILYVMTYNGEEKHRDVYEYYESGAKKSHTIYQRGNLYSKVEYNEDGTIKTN